jgi:MFS family permease
MAETGDGGRPTLFERYMAALRYGDFRQMWFANFFGLAAGWGLVAARGIYVFDQTHSTLWVGIITFAAMGPVFIVPPFAGVLADRIDRRTILGWTYAVNFVQTLVLSVLVLFGVAEMWHLVGLTLVNGVARAVQLPTSQALAANLVPRHTLLNALSITAAAQHGSRLVGPGLITPALAFLGAPGAFFLSTIFYGIGWYQIRRIKTASTGGVRAGESFVENFIDGLRYAFRQPLIKMVLVLVFFHCGFTMAYESLLPAFGAERLPHTREAFSILLTAIGLGGFVGSMLIGGVLSAVTRGRLFLVMGVLSGLGQVLLSFAGTLPVAFAAAVVMGGTQAAFMTMSQAITQSLAEDAYRGRLASINTFSLGGVMSLMNLVNGYAGTLVEPHVLLFVNGLVFVGIMVLSVLALTPRRIYLRGIPAEAHAT